MALTIPIRNPDLEAWQKRRKRDEAVRQITAAGPGPSAGRVPQVFDRLELQADPSPEEVRRQRIRALTRELPVPPISDQTVEPGFVGKQAVVPRAAAEVVRAGMRASDELLGALQPSVPIGTPGRGGAAVRSDRPLTEFSLEALDVGLETVTELAAQVPKIVTGRFGEVEAPTLFTEGARESLAQFRDRPIWQQIALQFVDPAIVVAAAKGLPALARTLRTLTPTGELPLVGLVRAKKALAEGLKIPDDEFEQFLDDLPELSRTTKSRIAGQDLGPEKAERVGDVGGRLAQEPGPLGDFFRNRPQRIANKAAFEDFVQNNVQPAFFQQFGDAPFYNVVRRGDEFLIEITTAGWEARAVSLGLERVQRQGNLYRLPLISNELPASTTPLRAGGTAPPSQPPPPTTGGITPPTGGLPELPTGPPPKVAAALEQAEAFRTIDAPGRTGRLLDTIPGISQIQRVLRPANKLPEKVQTAWVASAGEKAAFLTDQFPSRSRIFQQIDELFGADAIKGNPTGIRFIGPDIERVGIEGTVLDIAQRPQFYDLTPQQRTFLTEWQARQSRFQQELIEGYGAKVGEFQVAEGSVFLSNVDQGAEMLKVMDQTVDQAIRQGRGQTRLFNTAADRMKTIPDFTPVTDIRKLVSGMDEWRGTVVGRQVFKEGVGGKTRIEVVDLTHPGLRTAKEAVARKITNLEARIVTAERQMGTAGVDIKRISTDLDKTQRRAAPMLERLEELGEEWGPELSFLSGQVRELIQKAGALERRGLSLTERAIGAAERRTSLLTELNELAPQLDQLRKRYSAADLRPFQFVQEGIFRYFPADEAKAVRSLTEFSTSHWVSFLDNMRGGIFAGDLSPIAGVQLPLGLLFQPHRAIPRLVGAGKNSIQSRDLLNVFRESTMLKVVEDNVEVARDFAFFSGFPVQTGTPQEFAGGFLRLIPGFGPKFQVANERMYSVVLRQSLDLFDDTTQRLARAGVVGDDAKVVAADMATKVFPMWNPARLGLSQSRAAAIRALPTSVSFIMRPAAMIGEATTGFAKIALKQTLTSQERMAVQLITVMSGSVMTLSLTSAAISALLRGDDPIAAMKEVADPTSGKFGSVIIGGRRIPLGGPFRGMIKAIAPREVDWAPVPVPFANIFGFFTNRLNPFVQTQIRLLRDKTFQQGKILRGDLPEQIVRGLAFELEGSIPLAGGTAIAGVRRGLDPGEIGEEVGAQFLGVNLQQETPFQQRDLEVQRWAKETGIERGQKFQLQLDDETVEVDQSQKIESFYDLVPSDRQRFEAENPGVFEAIKRETKRRAEEGIEFAVRRQEIEDIKTKHTEDQLADDDRLTADDLSPSQWREQRKTRRLILNTQRGTIYDKLDPRDPETLLDYYFQKFDQLEEKYNGQMTDDAWEELELWVNNQSVDVREYLDANTGLAPMTPKEQEYKADLETLKPYWDIPDWIIRNPERTGIDSKTANTYQEYLDASPTQQKILLRVNPGLRNVVNRIAPGWRKFMRISPNGRVIDDLVRKWEYAPGLPVNLENIVNEVPGIIRDVLEAVR